MGLQRKDAQAIGTLCLTLIVIFVSLEHPEIADALIALAPAINIPVTPPTGMVPDFAGLRSLGAIEGEIGTIMFAIIASIATVKSAEKVWDRFM